MAYRCGRWTALTGAAVLIVFAARAGAVEPAPLPTIGAPPPPLPGERASGAGYISRTCADLHRVIVELPANLESIRGESLNLSEREPDDIWRATVTPPGFSNCVVMELGGDWLAGYSCDDSSVEPDHAVPYEDALRTVAGCLDVSWGARVSREDRAWVYEFFHVNGPMHGYLRVNPEDGAKALDIYSDGRRRTP